MQRRVERSEVVDPVDGDVTERRVIEEEPTYAPSAGVRARVVSPDAAVVTPPAAAMDEVHATAYDPYATRRRASHRLVQGLWLLFGIVEGLLAIRFVLRLLGANEAAGFAQFIYAASGPFVAPFNNLFGNPGSAGSVLELNTIVAMLVYMLVAWLVVKVVWLLAGETRSATRTVAGSTRTRLD
jgi:YggT family protein